MSGGAEMGPGSIGLEPGRALGVQVGADPRAGGSQVCPEMDAEGHGGDGWLKSIGLKSPSLGLAGQTFTSYWF